MKQSKYFYALLENEWADSKIDKLVLEFPDKFINLSSCEIAFRSLYTDIKSEINETNAINIIATASFLQLEPLRKECVKIIEKILSWENIDQFQPFLDRYYLTDLSEYVDTFMASSLFLLEEQYSRPQYLKILRSISKQTLERIFSLSKFVMCKTGTENLVYVFLRDWYYAQISNDFSASKASVAMFFENNEVFLQDEKLTVFENVRLKQIVCSTLVQNYASKIKSQKLIPESLINAAKQENWDFMSLLNSLSTGDRINPELPHTYQVNIRLWNYFKVEPNSEITQPTSGFEKLLHPHQPKNLHYASHNLQFFNDNCFRFSKKISTDETDSQIQWTWDAFSFGINLKFNYNPKICFQILCNSESSIFNYSQQNSNHFLNYVSRIRILGYKKYKMSFCLSTPVMLSSYGPDSEIIELSLMDEKWMHDGSVDAIFIQTDILLPSSDIFWPKANL